MFGLSHLFDNGLLALILLAALTLFLLSVVYSIVSCMSPRVTTGHKFTYIATALAGLVLSVASGVLGKPATIDLSKPVSIQTGNASVHSSIRATVSNSQVGDFQQLYAWSYVIAGLGCLIVFAFETPENSDIVKNVGLSTLGFLVTIVGTSLSQAPAIAQVTGVVQEVNSKANALF